MTNTNSLAIKPAAISKMAVAFVAAVMGVLVAFTSAASAVSVPTTKADCKNGGWQDYGTMFQNQGQCIKFVAAQKAGNGYGGNTTVVNQNPNILLDIKNAGFHTINITVNYITNIFN